MALILKCAGNAAGSAAVVLCAGIAAAGLGGIASAQASQHPRACMADLEDVSRQWRQLEYPDDRGGQVPPASRRVGPPHAGPHVEYMRNQLRLALRQCQEGNTEEAQLRIGLIRSWLALPEMRR